MSVLLALSLLEMVVKNCGFAALRYVQADMCGALVALVKKRESWRYSAGRNLHKTIGSWLPSGFGIDQEERKLWLQAAQKVLEMLQLWTSAFMLHEAELQPVFASYKQLRQEGYKFPKMEHGTFSGLCLMHGAEESPVFQAAGGFRPPDADLRHDSGVMETSVAREEQVHSEAGDDEGSETSVLSSRARDTLHEDVNAAREVLQTLSGGNELLEALPSAELEEFLHPLRAAQQSAARRIQELAEGSEQDDSELGTLLALLEDINAVLLKRSSAFEAGSDAAVPPPPSGALPSREEQEQFDEILARYLQERENESFLVNESDDRALAMMLSLQDEFGHRVAFCGRCRAANQMDSGGPDHYRCYACGHDQSASRAAPVHQSRQIRPVLHAPPPRVMCTSGPELCIGSSLDEDEALKDRKVKDVKARPRAGSGSFGASAYEALLGQPVGSAKSWAKSWVPSAGSYTPAVVSLGDGMGQAEYMEMGADGASDAASPMCGGNARSSSSALSTNFNLSRLARIAGSSLPFLSKVKEAGDNELPLMERLHVDSDWELIRPSAGRPYWYNSRTQVSQWEPPDVVRNGRSD